jgi:hypothetical protein
MPMRPGTDGGDAAQHGGHASPSSPPRPLGNYTNETETARDRAMTTGGDFRVPSGNRRAAPVSMTNERAFSTRPHPPLVKEDGNLEPQVIPGYEA